MKQNESPAHSKVNLFPITAISCLSLFGVVAALVMLWGLHNKVPKPSDKEMMTIVTADEIGEINLDQGIVRINLMARNDKGGIEKLQEIEIPLENFPAGYSRLQSFWDGMIEKGVLIKK